MHNITLTSKIGKFSFAEGTPISLAKMVRDSITGQWLAPKDRELELYCVDDAYLFIGRYESRAVNTVEFSMELYPAYALAAAMYKARKATSHFGDVFQNVGTISNLTAQEFEKLVGMEG